MLNAKKLRSENIAQYILYLWQLEDFLRALQMSPEAIHSQLVAPVGAEDDVKEAIFVWYMEIAGLLEKEEKTEHGHLEHTLHLIADLQNLHDQLMVLPSGERYRALYSAVEPQLPELKRKMKKPEIGDVELFFRALYSVVLLRIKGIKGGGDKEEYIGDVLELISPVVAELATMFHRIERGEIDLFKGVE